MSIKITRRQLFKLGFSDISGLVFEDEKTENGKEPMEVFRPPGARKKEEEFLSLCEGCPDCSRACPHDVIFHLGPAAGGLEGTPTLNPNNNACRWCPDMPCIEACPTGALVFDRKRKDETSPIGKAVLNLETCLAEEGILCDRCAVTCPSDIKAITMRNRKPVLEKELCVGCGLCVFYCESTPVSLNVVPSSQRSKLN